MAFGVWRFSSALLLANAAVFAQANSVAGGAPIVQPGAPGHGSKVLTPSTATPPPRIPAAADVEFMQGMIHHHAQAVEMVDLLRTRSRNQKLQALGNRIAISQTDEMQYMRQWLQERGKPAPMAHGKMDHSTMNHGA